MPKLYAIAGGMFGDEGKGRVAQYFTKRCIEDYGRAICIRSVGGANAGHTIYIKDKKFKTHIMPVGAFYQGVTSVIGNGVYIDCELLLEEIRNSMGGDVYISPSAHVVLPLHKTIDGLKEEKAKLGTTKRGISVAASSKFSYNGLRICDLIDNKGEERLRRYIDSMVKVMPEGVIDVDKNIEVLKAAKELARYVAVPWQVLKEAERYGDAGFVVEGSQGAMLDINHGYMYPFVSAGSFTFNGLMDGIGYHMDPTHKVLALKSYNSLMSPVKMTGEIVDSEKFITDAGEFGTTTGRRRRVGWLDLNLVRYSAMVNGPTEIFLNRLDTLNWFIENGRNYQLWDNDYCEYTYGENAVDVHAKKILPDGESFIRVIEQAAGVRVKYVGIGPDEKDVIVR